MPVRAVMMVRLEIGSVDTSWDERGHTMREQMTEGLEVSVLVQLTME